MRIESDYSRVQLLSGLGYLVADSSDRGFMQLSFSTKSGRLYQFDSATYFDISLHLDFKGPHPTVFDAPKATSAPYRIGSLPLDTREGASCNCDEYSLNVHCNTTHTEGVGHITNDRPSILNILDDVLIPATLISVNCREQFCITDEMLADRLSEASREFLPCIIIRTLPNPVVKWRSPQTPYFHPSAVEYLGQQGVVHLITDLPSVDASTDEKLSAHHAFWGLDPSDTLSSHAKHRDRTITELVYIPDSLHDGEYLVNLQVASFKTDAAPSRPILFPMQEVYNDIRR